MQRDSLTSYSSYSNYNNADVFTHQAHFITRKRLRCKYCHGLLEWAATWYISERRERNKDNCPYRTLGCSFDKQKGEILQRRFLNTGGYLSVCVCVANVFHVDVQRKNQTATQTHSEKFLPLSLSDSEARAWLFLCGARCRNLQLPRALHKRAFLRFDKLWPSAPSEWPFTARPPLGLMLHLIIDRGQTHLRSKSARPLSARTTRSLSLSLLRTTFNNAI